MLKPYHSLRAFCGLILCCMLLALSLTACGSNGGNSGNTGGTLGSGNISTPAATTAPGNASTTTPGTAQVALSVVSVDIAVSPSSLSSYTCGTHLNVTYTATFHFPANNVGGLVKFQYTTDNGRSSTPTQLSVSPGQLTATYPIIWSGSLPADHTQPGPGGVIITSPNSYTSPLVAPSGACSPAASGPFKVTSIELAASPSLAGTSCGKFFKETYTAILHIAPGGPGGTIVFQYTTNNGRSSSQNISLYVAAGQTSVTYKFYWTGLLPADHTAPGTGIILMSAPDQGESPAASPAGQCA